MRPGPLCLSCLVAMSAAAQDAPARPPRLIDMHFHVWETVPTGPPRDSLLAAFRHFHLEKALATGLTPEVWPEEIVTAIALIEEAAFLTTEQKADIFYGNAARFLRLRSSAAR